MLRQRVFLSDDPSHHERMLYHGATSHSSVVDGEKDWVVEDSESS